MVGAESFFDDMKHTVALHCGDGFDGADLARAADSIISKGVSAISAKSEHVGPLWIWLEKKPVKIYAKFLFGGSKAGDFDKKSEISELSKQIKQIFKKGAFGAQIFIPYSELEYFISSISPIKDELFFNKKLCPGLYMDEIESSDWNNIFAILSKTKLDAIALDFANANFEKFVGQIYGLMNSLPSGFAGELHFYIGNNYDKIEQVWRIAEKIRPDILDKLKFFINV